MQGRASGRPLTRHLILWSAFCLAAPAACPPAAADVPPPITRNDFGQVGLIEIPSARMAPDGQLSLNASYFDNNQRYNLGFQLFPWMETVFKYSGLDHFSPAYPVYWDRSFSMKIRLWDESDLLPAVAIGANDLLGTGIYSGEYLVGSKQLGNIDASVGIGWGRLASTNVNAIEPAHARCRIHFVAVHSIYCWRKGELFNFGQYFHGETIGVFGGLNWRTPIEGLMLQAEYSSDRYVLERSRQLHPKEPVQFRRHLSGKYREAVQLWFVSYIYGSVLRGKSYLPA